MYWHIKKREVKNHSLLFIRLHNSFLTEWQLPAGLYRGPTFWVALNLRSSGLLPLLFKVQPNATFHETSSGHRTRKSFLTETLPFFVPQCLCFPNSGTELWIFTWARGHYHFAVATWLSSGRWEVEIGSILLKGDWVPSPPFPPAGWHENAMGGAWAGTWAGPWGGSPMFELRMVEKQTEARVRTASCRTSSGRLYLQKREETSVLLNHWQSGFSVSFNRSSPRNYEPSPFWGQAACGAALQLCAHGSDVWFGLDAHRVRHCQPAHHLRETFPRK